MKQRLISLINYIIFLISMGIVWYFCIQKNKIKTFESNQYLTSIQGTLKQQINTKVTFFIDPNFNQQKQLEITMMIENMFTKSIPTQVVIGIAQTQVQSQKSIFNIILEKSSKYDVIVQNLQNINLQIDDSEQDSLKNYFRELKRLVINNIPVLQDNIDSEYICADKLFIFDIHVVDFFRSKYSLIDIITTYQNQIAALFKFFGLNEQNYRINYQVLPEDIRDLIFQQNDEDILIQKQSIINMMDQISFDKQHRYNFKEYSLSNTFLILSDSDKNLFYSGNDEKSYIQYMYIAPNILINHLKFEQNMEDQISNHVFETFVRKLFLIEQYDTISSYTYIQNLDHASILRESYQLREKQRIFQRYYKELEHIKFIQNEVDYKITEQNLNEFNEKLQEIMEYLEQFNYTNYTHKQHYPDVTKDDSYAQLDTFSEEYLVGVYLPIFLPFVYPIIMGLIDEVRDIRKKKLIRKK